VKLGLKPLVSWLEVGSLSSGEKSGEVTSELEDVLLQAVEEAGLMEVALQPVPHSIPAAHQHCTYNTLLIGLEQQMKISLRILFIQIFSTYPTRKKIPHISGNSDGVGCKILCKYLTIYKEAVSHI
jgi:hypothetical protein